MTWKNLMAICRLTGLSMPRPGRSQSTHQQRCALAAAHDHVSEAVSWCSSSCSSRTSAGSSAACCSQRLGIQQQHSHRGPAVLRVWNAIPAPARRRRCSTVEQQQQQLLHCSQYNPMLEQQAITMQGGTLQSSCNLHQVPMITSCCGFASHGVPPLFLACHPLYLSYCLQWEA